MKSIINSIRNTSIYKIIDKVVFIGMLMLAAVSMYTLFYRQAVSSGGGWQSDIGPYIEEMLGINERYSFPYPIMFKTARLFAFFLPTSEMAMAVTITIFNVMAIIITKYIIEKQTKAYFFSTGATFGLFYLSMLYSDRFRQMGIPYHYRGVYSPNPWHNHTYMAARPFMIITFILGVYTLANYEKDFAEDNNIKVNYLKYILFAICLLLTTMTKPSYTLVHGITFFIIILWRFLRAKGKTFRQSLMFGIFYIPTIIDLLYQYSDVFVGADAVDTNRGIGIEPLRVWWGIVDNVPLAIVLAAVFPIVVLIFHTKIIKDDSQYRLSWQIYLISLLMWSVLYEKGSREWHGNFVWGYICGLFLIFMCSVIVLIKDSVEYLENDMAFRQLVAILFQWLIFVMHVLLGLKYFYLLLVYGTDYF